MLSNWIDGNVKSNIDKFISKYNTLDLNANITSLGILDGYYHLFEYLKNGKAYLTGSDNQILVLGKSVFVLDICNEFDIKLLNNLQRSNLILSIKSLPLPKEKKQNEIIYNIPYILDPANYKNSNQRNRLIKRPFKWFNNNKIEILEKPKSVSDVEDLHTEWVRRRIENPKIFTKFFPKKQYLDIVKKYLNNENSDNINYRGIFFYGNLKGEEELLSFRVVSQIGKNCDDLTNIARYWRATRVSNYCYITGIKYFYDNFGIENFNCGYYYNKSLGDFKMRYPHTAEPIYMYSRNKITAPTEKLSKYY